jgi:DNA-binding CsgD family transcriptional regulator/tetratricopeptide (TPR) repeat protein
VRPNFSLKDEATGVVRVCRLVEGSPLALELAAAWAKTMTAAAIADEIAQDLAFLASPLRNIQEKHRNMQAVFQRSWQLLNPEEQQVFQRLARFRGGFDRAAARHIADASLAVLSALVDRSLLRWRPNGRYDLHELVRQYAEEQLAQSPAELHQICNRHSAYYADFLANQHRALIGPQQRAAMAMIQTEFENVRLAWQWAVEQKRLEEIRRANLVLFSFCQRQGRYQEGLLLLEAALAMVTTCPQSPMRDQTLAEVLTGCGWLAMRLGQVVQARDAFENATTLYASGEFIPQPAMGSDPQTGLPLLAMISGDYAAALNLGQRAWQAAAARNDHPNQVVAGFGLTSAAIARGCYKEALDYARNTLALNKVVGSQWMMAYLYNQLGEITQQMGNFSAAKAYYQESYTIRQEFNDPEGMALALNHLAELAQAEADPLTAQTLYQQSLNLYKAINDRGGLVRSRYGLGLTAQQLGDEAQARQQWHAALTTAVEAQLTPLILRVITGIGAYLLERGIYERGIAALSFVQDHPASDQAVRKQAQQIVAAHDQPRPPLADHCQRPVGELQLDQLVGELLLELTLPIAPIELTPPALPPDTTPSAPPGEPLSDREVEVLRLIAAGLRNQEIAERLTVTLSTVKAHSNSIYRKLAVKSRVQAVARARALGIF